MLPFHPAATIAAGLGVLEIANDQIALVLLQVLRVVERLAGLRAGVDAVEILRAGLQVVTQPLVMLVPIRKLEDDFYLGVYRLAGLPPGRAPPRPSAPAGTASSSCRPWPRRSLVLAVCEEEIVKDDFIELPRRVLDDFLEFLPVRGRAVAERLI